MISIAKSRLPFILQVNIETKYLIALGDEHTLRYKLWHTYNSRADHRLKILFNIYFILFSYINNKHPHRNDLHVSYKCAIVGNAMCVLCLSQ